MNAVLSWLTPWWAKVAVIVVVPLLLFGIWTNFKHWVSKPMVEAALAKERAEVSPYISKLEAAIKERELTIATIVAASDAERTRQQTKINVKTIELKNALSQNEKSQLELSMRRGADDDFKRLLDSATANIGITTDASASTRLRQLTSAHHQCQAGFRDERTSHAKTIAGLEQALAVIEALKQ